MKKDRNPMLKVFSDKLLTREYVTKLGLNHILPELYWSGDNLEELRNILPNFQNFVLKPSEGSGATLICSDNIDEQGIKKFHFFNDPWHVYLYNSLNFDSDRALYLCSKWLEEDYSERPDSFQEWGYSGYNQKILLEQLLVDHDDKLPKDYKVFVFHGSAKLIQVDYNRFSNHTRAFFTPNWEKLDLLCLYAQSTIFEAKPPELEKMLEHAEAIANEIDFLRVDFYISKDGIKFGETTIYPGGGVDQFTPHGFNQLIGSYWNLNY
jgi:hypothetical protein